MKNTSRLIQRIAGLVVRAAIGFAVLSMTGCPTLDKGDNNQTPTIADFTVSGLSQIYDGGPKTVIVTAKYGKSPGLITVYYNRSTAAPSAIGAYPITFNVAAATGWNAVRGLIAGTLDIAYQIDNPQTPTADDFTIEPIEAAGRITAVTITPKQGKSPGIITVYFNGSTTFPTEVGLYTVTFDVAAAVGWNTASGLIAGYLSIGGSDNQTPTTADYNINGTGTFIYDGNVKTVTVTAKPGRSTGAITVKYNSSTTAPSAVGVYNVTFDVAAATDWNAAYGLSAGMLTITKEPPTFTSINAFGAWLSAQPANTAAAAYTVALNLDYLENYRESVKNVLNANSNKYVYLDLSGSTITTIPYRAFYAAEYPYYGGCHTLTGITIPDSVTSIERWAFFGCANLASITIPDSVTTIEDFAFCNCTSLASVTIGNNVTTIKDSAFGGCTSLISLTIGNGVTDIGNGAFQECISLSNVTIPNSVTSIGVMAFRSCNSLAGLTIGNSVNSIGDYAFASCDSLASVTIPDGVTSIGEGTFAGCTNLTSVTIPNGVISIGKEVFEDCTSLASITIPDSVTSIGEMAFWGCTNLTGINIPNSVASIGTWTFRDCASLASVIIGNGVTSIGEGAFLNCSNLASVTIPNGVINIGEAAFSSCTSLASVTIGNGVTSIGEMAFNWCTSLANVTIPNGVTSIGEAAFNYCTSLASVTIPNSVTSIGIGAFFDCTGLTSITIPNGVTSIRAWTFTNCDSLISITIPDNVTSIGMAAFTYCEKLTSVTFQGMITADNFRDDAFYGDLRDKYLAGGIGTYTTENPELNAVWTYKGNS